MISTYTLNHFGLISGICNELDIRGFIDRLIPVDPQQKVTTGQAVVSMIINGLGFSNRQLYLYPQFFEKKPVELLIDQGICADDLNDDTIGRALDRVYLYGCTELFCYLSYNVTKQMMVEKKYGHLDSTTFSVHGDYHSSGSEDAAVHITHGHSKAKRPDMKQIYLNLLVSFDGGIPLFMQALDGNSSDPVTFRNTVKEFKKGLKQHLQEITYLIADSKFYCKETIQQVKQDMFWISRVPDTIAEADTLLHETAKNLTGLRPLQDGYRYTVHRSTYGGIRQRWLIIYSPQAFEKAKKTIKGLQAKEFERVAKQLKTLQKKTFYCRKDACDALTHLKIKCTLHQIFLDDVMIKKTYCRRGRPSKKKTEEHTTTYHPQYTVKPDLDTIEYMTEMKALFILASNELREKNLSDLEIFSNYKNQRMVENGFRFLKDPLFFASSLFLKKPERIVALTMIMCIALLVYSIGERKLRLLLKEYNETIHDQIKKPTKTPTLRWIFQLFEDVHLIKIEENNKTHYEVKNLRPDAEKTLRILGRTYMEPYLLT
jgi:transposase